MRWMKWKLTQLIWIFQTGQILTTNIEMKVFYIIFNFDNEWFYVVLFVFSVIIIKNIINQIINMEHK